MLWFEAALRLLPSSDYEYNTNNARQIPNEKSTRELNCFAFSTSTSTTQTQTPTSLLLLLLLQNHEGRREKAESGPGDNKRSRNVFPSACVQAPFTHSHFSFPYLLSLPLPLSRLLVGVWAAWSWSGCCCSACVDCLKGHHTHLSASPSSPWRFPDNPPSPHLLLLEGNRSGVAWPQAGLQQLATASLCPISTGFSSSFHPLLSFDATLVPKICVQKAH